MRFPWWLVPVGLGVYFLFRKGDDDMTHTPPADHAPPSPDVEAASRTQATRQAVPTWMLQATGKVESGNRQLPPNQDGGDESRGTWTYYPYGMKPDAVITVGMAADRQQAIPILRDLDRHAEASARYLKRGMSKAFWAGGYGLSGDEWVRAWYKAPGQTKSAWSSGHAPRFRDDVDNAWLTNWRRARAQYGGAPRLV